jgi:putative PIN family toxin of toxin-antitoxin system
VPAVNAVLDTNVVVSAHLKPEGREALILDLALSRRFRMVVSEALLQEYEGVLRRSRLHIDPARITRSLRDIRAAAHVAEPRKRLQVTSDPDDNMVLECAVEGGADYLVTGNVRHFPEEFQGVRVVPPREFLVILAAMWSRAT